MKQSRLMKFFSTFLAIIMVLSLLTPMSSVAAAEKEKSLKTGNQSESVIQQKAAIAEQAKLSKDAPKLHADLEKVDGDQEIDVIIHLSEKPVALEQGIKELAGQTFTAANEKKAKVNVNAQQTMLKKEMKIKQISFKQNFTYNTVLNGFAATVKADQLDKLLDINGVTLVEPDAEVHAYDKKDKKNLKKNKKNKKSKKNKNKKKKDNITKVEEELTPAMDTSIPFLGIEPLWEEGFEGQGIKVAVLDTGIDKDHPDFAGIYKGGKNFVPHTGNDYARERADDDASETSPLDRPDNRPEFNANGGAFYTSHGTHVAGTIAAIGANKYGIKGIAPKIDLYAYRVLGAYGSGSTSGIIAAIEEAVNQEIDIINLSLGGGSNSETDAGSYAINNAMLAGTIGVIATGNSGPNRGTMGTPSTAPFGIAVGNTTNPETMYDAEINVNAGDYSLSKQLNLMSTTFGVDLETQLAGEYDLVAIPGSGEPADFEGIDVEGKVALISRGDIAFVEKIANAKENGAVATIIQNFAGGTNAPGISDVFLGDDFDFLPTVDMSQTDGDAIRTALEKADGKVSFSNVNTTMTEGDEVSDSSSRGPSVPNFDIKPDVTAPGTNIMSAVPMYQADFPEASYEKAFGRSSGTSMATPHVAGIAALVKQANPTWNAFDVKVALSNTAKLLDTDKYDVMSQGAGRVQAHAAAHANILAYGVDTAIPNETGESIENLKGTVTFGPQNLVQGDLSVTKEILVKDQKGAGGDYEVTVDVTKAFKDAKVTVDQSSFTLDGEQLLTITLTASQTEDVKTGDEILGYIHIDGVDTDISLPFAADFGGAATVAIEDMAIDETDLSFDGDGYKDFATLSFKITGNVKTNYIELWDLMDPEGGEFNDGYIGFIHAGASLEAGAYSLKVGGQYNPWSNEPATTIPDGLYTVDFMGETVSGNPPVISDYVGPIVVKSAAGTIEGGVSGTKATGKIVDKYIEYNTELADYGLSYDINTKLNASYEVTTNGETADAKEIELEQNGTFAFDVASLDENTESVVVKYVDAAGNKAEQTIYGEGVEPGTGPEIDVTPLDLIPSEPITDNPDVKSFGFDSIAISPNGDGNLDSTEFSFELNAPPATAVRIDIYDKADYAEGPYSQDRIGEIYFDSSRPISKTGTLDGNYITKSQQRATLDDGIYSFELSTLSSSYDMVIATVKPYFVKSTKPEITFTADDTTITGSIKDQFIDFKAIVEDEYKQDYDVNDYLVVTAHVEDQDGEVTKNNITLEQDGTFTSALEGVVGESRVTLVAQDIAQNDAQKSIFVIAEEVEEDIVDYALNKDTLSFKVGESEQLIVTETTTSADGTVTEEEVTQDATFESKNDAVATVQNGNVTAVDAGSTEITVVYEEFTATVSVDVAAVEVDENIVKYTVSKQDLQLGVGQQEQLIVTETTTTPDGEVTKKDVTMNGKYNVVNNKIATVHKGLVSAHEVGKTQVRVMLPGQETIYVYLEVLAVPKDIVTYSVSKKDLKLGVGQQEQLIITETRERVDGTTVEKDITSNTKFNVVNNKIAKVNKGLVTAHQAGKTQVRVMIPGEETSFVYLEVKEMAQDIVTYEINKTNLKMKKGKQEQLKVTEITVKPNGKVVEKDVTHNTNFKVVNNKIATVQTGLVSAHKKGKTQVLVTVPNEETKLVYLEVK